MENGRFVPESGVMNWPAIVFWIVGILVVFFIIMLASDFTPPGD